MGKGEEQFDELLKTLVPLNGLAPQYQREVLLSGEVVEYRKGKYIFKQGDKDNQAVYLLAGELDMYADRQVVKHVVAGTDAARYALAQLQPRQFSAKARTRVSVLRLDRDMLDKLLALGFDSQSNAEVEVSEIEADEPLDWMTRMLQSELFQRIPAANIQRIFSLMEPVEVSAGDLILRQGDRGDYYYVIQTGQCKVLRQAPSVKRQIQLAELKEGDAFGDESLVSGATRNATIKMVTDGELMRLAKHDFIELIRDPVLKAVSLDKAKSMVSDGAVWIDARSPDEHAKSGVNGSRNIPLNLLRMEARKLDKKRSYCVYCDTGQRSAVGAFLLTERGFDACYIQHGIFGAATDKQPRPAGKTKREEPIPPKTVPPRVAAATPKAAPPQEAASAPKAAPPQEAASASRAPIPQDTAFTPTAVTKGESRHAESSPNKRRGVYGWAREASASDRNAAEADARASYLKAELAKANFQLEEALRLKNEAEAARKEVEQAIAAKQENLKQHAEQALREAESAKKEARLIQAASAQTTKEREQLQRMKAEAEARLREERKAVEAEAAKAREQLEEALKLRSGAEDMARTTGQSTRLKLHEQQASLQAEAKRAAQAMEQAMRLKQELESAKQQAEREAERKRQEEEARVRELREKAERELREEKARLEAEYATNAAELAEIQRKKEEAEQRLEDERKRVAAESQEARRQMGLVARVRRQMEKTRRAFKQEAKRHAEDLAQEQQRREEIQANLAEDKRRLEAAFARNEKELERARQEKAAAEAARKAAAAEAERMIAEYKASYEAVRKEKEAELRAERQRLQADSQRIQKTLEAAQRTTAEAQIARQAAEREATRLKRQAKSADSQSSSTQKQIRAQIAALQAGLDQASQQAEAAQKAQAQALAAKKQNEVALIRQRQAEAEVRRQLEKEVEEWRIEQAELEKALQRSGATQIQQEHMKRLKNRAEMAKRSAEQSEAELLADVRSQLNGGK